MADKIPQQKLSISYLWEYFLVLEHRIPIWFIFVLGFSVKFVKADHNSLDTHMQRCFQNVLDHQNCDTCTRTQLILQRQCTVGLDNCDMCTRVNSSNLGNSLIHDNLIFVLWIEHWCLSFCFTLDTCTKTEPILQTWKYHEFTKPLFL